MLGSPTPAVVLKCCECAGESLVLSFLKGQKTKEGEVSEFGAQEYGAQVSFQQLPILRSPLHNRKITASLLDPKKMRA